MYKRQVIFILDFCGRAVKRYEIGKRASHAVRLIVTKGFHVGKIGSIVGESMECGVELLVPGGEEAIKRMSNVYEALIIGRRQFLCSSYWRHIIE